MDCDNCKNIDTCRFVEEGRIQEYCRFYIPEIEAKSSVDCRVSPKTAELDLETMIDNLPENRVLYKDSGLWMIINEEDFNTTDKMLFQVARYQQTTKETFVQFIKRCFDSENRYYITE